MSVFPLGLRLQGRLCVVFGAGEEQAARAKTWHALGAKVRVVAATLAEELQPLVLQGAIEHLPRGYMQGDLAEAWLAVLVDSNSELATRIFEEAERERVFFCAVDQPQSSYSHLAQARAGDLVIAISTNGRVPALGRRLRQELERLLVSSDAESHVARLAKLRDSTRSAERRRVLGDAVSQVRFSGGLSFGEPGEGEDQ
ncbi:MAG: bifunctional precorrin-2 dehydrogenase/sirohydrochlorin ferrochelatase [Polyangiaceae bacterium]